MPQTFCMRSVSTLRCRVPFIVIKGTKSTQSSTFGIPQPSHKVTKCFLKSYYFDNSHYAPCAKVGAILCYLSRESFFFFLFTSMLWYKLGYHRRDAYKLSSCPDSICRRKRFAFMGLGVCTQRYVANENKTISFIKVSTEQKLINSEVGCAAVELHLAPPSHLFAYAKM